MLHQGNFLVVVAGLVITGWISGGEVAAQCNGGGGRGGPPTGSPAGLNSSVPYASNPLTSNRYSQNGLLAQQYQQQVLATQNQIASTRYQIAERQRFVMMQRETQARPYRLARAEAKRAARAKRTAARLQQQQRSPSAYSLTSVSTD